jgi:predicted phage terminase large subunit-like protein|tara:strand:- start:2411 stop:3673 length:1263 start_codon:yes stop_codon:yes gene_type:complete
MPKDILEPLGEAKKKVFDIKFPPLHDAQKEVHESPARWKILCAGRRFGKSRLGVQMCMEVALQGGRAWWVAPTFAISRVGWRDIQAAAASFPKEMGVNIKVGDMQVDFGNGGFIGVRSADNPQRLRGEGLDFLVMDEAAFVKEETWTEVLRPTLTERKGSALFISTPKGMDNWFYRLFERAKQGGDWERFQFPSTSNPLVEESEVLSAKDEIGSLVFAQEYMAQFISEGSQMFKQDWFRYYKEGVGQVHVDGETYDLNDLVKFGTVDLATSTRESADYTVIGSFGLHQPSKKLFVLDMHIERMEAPDIIPQIKRSLIKHNLEWVGIERAGFQLALVQFARREGLPVLELKADRDKRQRALPLSAKMEAGLVYLPKNEEYSWVADVERELLTFPVGAHDDIVDCLSYAVVQERQQRKWEAY